MLLHRSRLLSASESSSAKFRVLGFATFLLLALPAFATTYTVGDSASLTTALTNAISGDTIEFTADISLTTSLPTIGTSLTINGNGHVLDGNNTNQGFQVMAGTVLLQDLTVQHTLAQGGAGTSFYGGQSGGGGAGLGAGLYVASGANVTLSNMNFVSNLAQGGNANGQSDSLPNGGGLNSSPAPANGALPGGFTNINLDGTVGGFGQGGGGGSFPDGFNTFSGGNGGAGGFGGGGGAATGSYSGGTSLSGFGGQGGGAGFGGGAGGNGGNDPAPIPIAGGFGGGGGGLGAGGAIFVQEGGALTLGGNLEVNANTASGGSGQMASTNSTYIGTNGANGSGLGAGLFLQGSGTFSSTPGAGQMQTIADAITDEIGSGLAGGAGSWALNKSGAGTLVLTGANAYSGLTTVSAGTLLANNTTGSATGTGAVSVLSGATLGGTGFIGGPATFASGAHLAPGGASAPGTLTFSSSVTLNDGALLDFRLGTAGDQALVTGGTLTGPASEAGATFLFSAGSGFAAGTTYNLIDGTGATLSGFDATKFAGTGIAGYTFAFDLSGNILQVTATAIPEPATYAALAGLGALGLVCCKRRRRVPAE